MSTNHNPNGRAFSYRPIKKGEMLPEYFSIWIDERDAKYVSEAMTSGKEAIDSWGSNKKPAPAPYNGWVVVEGYASNEWGEVHP